jgi:hypothetical protein
MVSLKQRMVALRQRGTGPGWVVSVSGRGGRSWGQGGFGSCEAAAGAALASATTAMAAAASPQPRVRVLPSNLPLSCPLGRGRNPASCGLEGDRIAFFTQTGSQKARNLARDGRVAISITDHGNPYRTARIRGRLADTLEGEVALEVIDRLSTRYTGQPFPMRSGVVYLIEPQRVGFMELPFADRPGGRER